MPARARAPVNPFIAGIPRASLAGSMMSILPLSRSQRSWKRCRAVRSARWATHRFKKGASGCTKDRNILENLDLGQQRCSLLNDDVFLDILQQQLLDRAELDHQIRASLLRARKRHSQGPQDPCFIGG